MDESIQKLLEIENITFRDYEHHLGNVENIIYNDNIAYLLKKLSLQESVDILFDLIDNKMRDFTEKEITIDSLFRIVMFEDNFNCKLFDCLLDKYNTYLDMREWVNICVFSANLQAFDIFKKYLIPSDVNITHILDCFNRYYEAQQRKIRKPDASKYFDKLSNDLFELSKEMAQFAGDRVKEDIKNIANSHKHRDFFISLLSQIQKEDLKKELEDSIKISNTKKSKLI